MEQRTRKKIIIRSTVRQAHARESSQLLRNTRARHGLTQQALAKLLNVPTQTVSRWERTGTPFRPVIREIILERVREIYERKGEHKVYELDEGRIVEIQNGKHKRIFN